jgi:hypothetical protein
MVNVPIFRPSHAACSLMESLVAPSGAAAMTDVILSQLIVTPELVDATCAVRVAGSSGRSLRRRA